MVHGRKSVLRYFIVNSDPTTSAPNIAKDTRLKPLLCPSHDDWSIFESSQLHWLERSGALPSGVKPVSSSLSNLLYSADFYPPALALTQEGLLETSTRDIADFCCLAETLLKRHLQGQRSSGCFLAEASCNSSNFLEGCYYWIVGLAKTRRRGLEETIFVRALCEDGQIYPMPLHYWKLEPESVLKQFDNKFCHLK